MLALPSDKGWEKGDEYGRPELAKRRTASRWSLAECDGDIDDWHVTIDRLIERLRPIETAFRGLPRDVYVRMMLCITEDNDIFGFWLTKEQMEFLVRIGADLDMSFVVRGFSRRGEEA